MAVSLSWVTDPSEEDQKQGSLSPQKCTENQPQRHSHSLPGAHRPNRHFRSVASGEAPLRSQLWILVPLPLCKRHIISRDHGTTPSQGPSKDFGFGASALSCLKPLPASTLHGSSQVWPRSGHPTPPPPSGMGISPDVLANTPPPQVPPQAPQARSLACRQGFSCLPHSARYDLLPEGSTESPEFTPYSSFCQKALHAHLTQAPTPNACASCQVLLTTPATFHL